MPAIPRPNKWERWVATWPEEHVAKPAVPHLTVTDNPVKATLLGPNGEPIRQVVEREPFGYRQRP